jgi:hypothetical protein
MSVQPHFGGYTSCNRDVPFTADHTDYFIDYVTTKTACTIRIFKIESDESRILVSELAGVFSGLQYKVEIVY